MEKQFIETNFFCSGCKKVLSSKRRLETHTTGCLKYCLNIQKEKYEFEMKEQDKKFQQILNEKDKHIKELEDRMHSLLVKAVSTPSSVTNTDNRIQQNINNLIPLTDDHLTEQAQFLTIDHIKQGALGYANFACDFALKDRIACVDLSRRKIKYKNSDGQIITDPEMTILSRKLFSSIKDKNTKLTNQYRGELKDMILKKYMESGDDITDEETKELENEIDHMNKEIQECSNLYYQTVEITDGKKPNIYHDFIREVCNKTNYRV